MREVREGWTASYADPIRLGAGEAVRLTGREDIWDGYRWLWAIAPDGREGWVPDTLIVDGRATRNYSAQELTCAAGDSLTVIEELHGWAWCDNGKGSAGWVPLRCLS